MQHQLKVFFTVHCHQPVGNFDSVIEYNFQKAYAPFLQVLEEFPAMKIHFHYSGALLEWIQKKHAEFFEKLQKLTEKGQIEWLTGGFYEPIFPLISSEDRIGQIRKLSDYIQHYFHQTPCGAWLTERIWEPHFPKDLAQADVDFTLLDENFFQLAGMEHHKIARLFLTEAQGYPLKIFPINKTMRYAIPFNPPEAVLDTLQILHENPENQLVVIANDGEKFGGWPFTYQTVYQEKWLYRLFEQLLEKDWLEVTHFSEYNTPTPPLPIQQVYLPSASYPAMMEWALSTERQKQHHWFLQKTRREMEEDFEYYEPFIQGGFWQNFLIKYPEINLIHKRMLFVEKKLHDFCEANQAALRQDEDLAQKTEVIRDHLWKSQCSCAYWHGLFGGAYLPHLRDALFQQIIQAEKQLDALLDTPQHHHVVSDLNYDGQPELLMSSPYLNTLFLPHAGGAMAELDEKQTNTNLLNSFQRREEAYHSHIFEIEHSKHGTPIYLGDDHNEPLSNYLHFDWHPRHSLLDHFFDEDANLIDFAFCNYHELGDFVNQPYAMEIAEKAHTLSATFTRNGGLWENGYHYPIQVRKAVSFQQNEFDIRYTITNQGQETRPLWMGIEFNLAIPTANDRQVFFARGLQLPKPERHVMAPHNSLDFIGLRDLDRHLEVTFQMDQPFQIWRIPIYTVSRSEKGYEKILQSVALILNKKFSLQPSEKLDFNIVQTIIKK